MRKFMVNVNGTSYEVEVEEMTSAPQAQQVSAPKNEEKKTAAPAPKASAGATTISSPMPGTIKKVAVKAGDKVKKNDVLFILEAMKLENEIMSPCDGTVVSVGTSESSSVNPGDVLCVIE